MERALDPEFEKLKKGEWGKIITAERLALYEKYLGQKEFLKDSTGIDLTQSRGAILRRHDIESLSDPQKRQLPLIHPFDEKELLKSASCTLRLGCHYRVNGREGFLGPDNPTLVIPRHGIAIVTTFEWLNIPTFLIARWNLRVHRVYDGLVWVGGPQVDPGYQGFLFCPLYNLSNHDQKLTYGRRLFTIDFSLTTLCDEEEIKKSDGWKPKEPRDTFTFWGLDIQKIESAPKVQFEEMGNDIKDIRSEVRRFQGIVFPLLAIIMMALAIIATLNATTGWTEAPSSLILSIFAIIIALSAMITAIVSRK